MVAILNSTILDSASAMLDSDTLFSSLRFTQKHSHSTLTLTQTNSIWLKLIHSHSTWWWQPSWILPCWSQTPCFLLSDSLKNTLSPLWLWLKLIQSDSNSFILTQLDDGSHLEFYHLGFSHLSFSSQTHSHLPRLVPTICTKKLHSHFPPKFRIWSSPGARPHFPSHPPHPWRSPRVISPLSHFCGTTLSVAEEPPGHCTNSLNGKASLDRRSKHAHAHI